MEPSDEALLEPFTVEGEVREALLRYALEHGLAGSPPTTDAAVLRALVRIGASTLRDEQLQEGYAAMAQEYRANDAERRDQRTRRVERDATRD